MNVPCPSFVPGGKRKLLKSAMFNLLSLPESSVGHLLFPQGSIRPVPPANRDAGPWPRLFSWNLLVAVGDVLGSSSAPPYPRTGWGTSPACGAFRGLASPRERGGFAMRPRSQAWHHPSRQSMPRSAFASSVILSGLQGGSNVNSTSTSLTPGMMPMFS